MKYKIHKKSIIISSLVIALITTLGASLLCKTKKADAVAINLTGRAQILKTDGDLNFTSYSANVTTSDIDCTFDGYGWSSDIGWVAFGNTDNPDGPVTCDLATGILSGKASIINDGSIIDFNAAPYNSNVRILSSGDFTGYAWSMTLGWINFTGVSAPGIIIGPASGLTSSPTTTNTISTELAPVDTASSPASASNLTSSSTTNAISTELPPVDTTKKEIIELPDFKFYFVLENGNLEVEINGEKDFELVKNSELLIGIPADIFAKGVNAITITTANSSYPMNFLADKNKYQAVISVPQKGECELRILIAYKDDTIQEIKKTILVDPQGYIFTKSSSYFGLGRKQEMRIEGAEITLYKLENGEFQKWDAKKFKQNNPVISDQSGEYSFFVPNGEYYLQVKKSGYRDKKSDNFKVENQVLNKNIELELNIKPWTWVVIMAVLTGIVLVFLLMRKKIILKIKKGVRMKKLITILVSVIVLATGVSVGSGYVLAEQSGSSPESGVTSYFKATYDSIVALSHGSVAAGAWGDWGAYWNRIRSAAEWVPSGDAAVTDVVLGKTFYKDSREQATGTKLVVGPCPTQQYHDYSGIGTEITNCSQTWAVDNSVTGAEKKDPFTGLIWSNPLWRSDTTISFSPSSTATFSWNSSSSNNQNITSPVAGSRTAIQLCADQGNGWRLPTQKELMQAYIDGSYWNLTQPANYFWSATDYNSTYAWNVLLSTGYTSFYTKTNSNLLRCVR